MGSLKKDFIKVAGSNILLLLASTLNNFVLPIILSISDYANYKTYILYISFSGFFHLGYVDGMNIKYGGKELHDLDSKTFWSEHHFFLLTQLLVTIVLLATAYFSHSWVMALFALTVMPLNMQSFFLFFMQAVGQFTVYAKCAVIVPLLMGIVTCIVFAFHISGNYILFSVTQMLCYLISWSVLEWLSARRLPFSYRLNFQDNKRNHWDIIRSGFFIMMGTIVFGFFSTAGRWLIKWNMNDESFALYSMAASLLGFVLIFVNAVNKVFYPYLCRNVENKKGNQLLVDVLLILSTFSLPFFFLLKFVIDLILPKYADSIDIVKILLMTLPAVVIIQSYYINLYKAKRQERAYLRDGILYTLLAVAMNSVAVFAFHDLKMIALASVICSYIWFFLPNTKIYRPEHRTSQAFYFMLIFTIYIASDIIFDNVILSFVVSLAGILLINMTFYKELMAKAFVTKLKK